MFLNLATLKCVGSPLRPVLYGVRLQLSPIEKDKKANIFLK